MNISHPLVFLPLTTFNHSISSSDIKGAILIGVASAFIGSFLNSITERLLAHKPGHDIEYDKWTRNMIFHAGFSKSLFTWLRGGDSLRKPHYHDDRKKIHLSRLLVPLTLKAAVIVSTVTLIILSIPTDVEFSSDRGVGIAAFIGGTGTEPVDLEPTGCSSFRRDSGRFTQTFDLQLCVISSSLTQTTGPTVESHSIFSMLPSNDSSWFLIGSTYDRQSIISKVDIRISGQINATWILIKNSGHRSIASVVRKGLRRFGCEMAEEPLPISNEIDSRSHWEVEKCSLPEELHLTTAALQTIVGSIYVTTNNLETEVSEFASGSDFNLFEGQLSKFSGAIVVASEPILGLATLLLLAVMLMLVDAFVSFIKPGESDYLSVTAQLVREMAGVDCLDNPLQAERGHVIRFCRVLRGTEGHVGYVRKDGDKPVDDFPEGTVVRASASDSKEKQRDQ